MSSKNRFIVVVSCTMLVAGLFACKGLAYQGLAEKVGKKLDQVGQGVKQGTVELGETVKKKFEGVQYEVQKMETQNRVYARIHWDKALNKSGIEVHHLKGGAILLRGIVPDAAAKKKAVALAIDTVGVTEVVDELGVPVQPNSRIQVVPKDSSEDPAPKSRPSAAANRDE